MKHGNYLLKTCVLLVLFVCAFAAPSALAQSTPRVYIEADETVDSASADIFSAKDKENKAKQVDFGSALSAALVKKNTPVVIVTDKSKAQWIING